MYKNLLLFLKFLAIDNTLKILYSNKITHGEFKTADWLLPYPEINLVPVIFLCGAGGKSARSSPIKVGDSGLIISAEGQLTDFLTGTAANHLTRLAGTHAVVMLNFFNTLNCDS